MKKFFTPAAALLLAAIFLFSTQAYSQTVRTLYSETFTGGLNGWTSAGISSGNPVWTHAPNGDGSKGAFAGSIGAIASPTGSTGAVSFDSDFYDNGGDPAKQGAGPIPAPHISELISPTIDLSNTQGATLEFYQHYVNFSASTFIAYSKDDGATWSAPLNVNDDIFSGIQTQNPSKKVIPLFYDGGTTKFKVKFIFDGDYYYWTIDDVKILDTPKEFSIGTYNFYGASSYAQPAKMIETDSFGFFCNYFNGSTAAQANVAVRAQIINRETGALVNEFVENFTTMAPGMHDTLDFGNKLWAPKNLTRGRYYIRYTIGDGTPDYDTTNNVWTRQFEVTDTIFSKESRILTDRGSSPGGDYAMGNLYTTSKNLVDKYKASSLTFSVYLPAASGTLSGKKVNLYLLEVDDSVVDADWNGWENTKYLGDNTGLLLKGYREFTFTSTQRNNTLYAGSLEDLDGKIGVDLKPGTRYVALAEYNGPANTIRHSTNHVDLQYRFISTIIWSTDDARWYLGGFGQNVAAVLRMGISLATSTDDIALPDGSLTIAPNPVSDQLTVSIDLAESAEVANLTIADINGQVLQIDELFNLQKDVRQYDFSQYANGMYIVRLATAQGTKTIKVMVQR